MKMTSGQYASAVVILFTFFLWMASHEVWHFLACSLQGFEAESDFLSFAECRGLERASLLGVFAYDMAPYLAGIILIAVAWLWRPGKLPGLRAALPAFALIDALGNASGILRKENDFTILFRNIPQAPSMGIAVIAAVLLPAALFYFYRWREARGKRPQI